MASWNWNQNWNGLFTNIVFNSYCDLHPWLANNVAKNCGSMCFRWQFNYTIPGSSTLLFHTVRGCAEQLFKSGTIPGGETCPPTTHTSVGVGQPGGGIYAGDYNTCFCTGDLCNPATKTAAFGIATMMLIALFASIYQ